MGGGGSGGGVFPFFFSNLHEPRGIAVLTRVAYIFTRVTPVSNHERVSFFFSSSYFFLLYIGDFLRVYDTTIYLYDLSMRKLFLLKSLLFFP